MKAVVESTYERTMRIALSVLFSIILITACSAQTLVGDGVTDNKPIWDQIVANVCASQDRSISIPKGEFRFASAMAPIPCSLQVQGQGPGVTNLIMDFSSSAGSGYLVSGGIDPYGGGSLRDVGIYVASGQTIAFAVTIQAHLETDPNVGSHNPHGWLGDNIIIGRAGTAPFTGSFNYGFYLDGSVNANPPAGIAPGIRLVRIYRSSVSAFNILPALAYYAKGSQFVGFNCPAAASATGQYNIMGIHDDGGTFTQSPCPYVAG